MDVGFQTNVLLIAEISQCILCFGIFSCDNHWLKLNNRRKILPIVVFIDQHTAAGLVIVRFHGFVSQASFILHPENSILFLHWCFLQEPSAAGVHAMTQHKHIFSSTCTGYWRMFSSCIHSKSLLVPDVPTALRATSRGSDVRKNETQHIWVVLRACR